jgi:hypothetical protein
VDAVKTKLRDMIFRLQWTLMSDKEHFVYLWDDKKPSLRALIARWFREALRGYGDE